MADRTGRRISRELRMQRRTPSLGYYIIMTDTEQTEHNYLSGLRDSISPELRDKLVIKVSARRTISLVEESREATAMNPQYAEPWIVFDRDQVKNFDAIIQEAERHGIHVGWSNPCIEIWFHVYLGEMPHASGSVACNEAFEHRYKTMTGQKYQKADKNIYSKLCRHGDEAAAIRLAERKLTEHLHHGKCTPSEMSPCTTLHRLVQEIRLKSR